MILFIIIYLLLSLSNVCFVIWVILQNDDIRIIHIPLIIASFLAVPIISHILTLIFLCENVFDFNRVIFKKRK